MIKVKITSAISIQWYLDFLWFQFPLPFTPAKNAQWNDHRNPDRNYLSLERPKLAHWKTFGTLNYRFKVRFLISVFFILMKKLYTV